MLEIYGGCFSVRLIRELEVFSVFVSFFGGASYMRKYTVLKRETMMRMFLDAPLPMRLLAVLHRCINIYSMLPYAYMYVLVCG